ncbi:PREDICTED: uncharacterized protein LOC18601269 [Theobroma cacao]|uniref:Uncharacterized protein LOC18601269 n=1 Tax=Theobroma cacao TaxID=3641 RepID=A0AB32W913_THECC|nr:PREDICTED: uncharacterized protein LOC18601269 [Theobroma cacao]
MPPAPAAFRRECVTDIFSHCMQRRNNLNLVPFDLEIEITFRRRQRENLQVAALSQTMAEDNNNNGNNTINLVFEANRALRDYVVPLLQGCTKALGDLPSMKIILKLNQLTFR